VTPKQIATILLDRINTDLYIDIKHEALSPVFLWLSESTVDAYLSLQLLIVLCIVTEH
jgi:hypothetical protein